MTALLNMKKTAQDSISLAHNYESYYRDKASELAKAGRDSTVWYKMVDSSTYFWAAQQRLQEQIKAADFSIDSLSKMN
jgi:hypothetical protein